MPNDKDTLSEGLDHAKAIPTAASEIRDIFKKCKEDLYAIRDEAKEFAEDMVSRARAGLDAFKATAGQIEREARGQTFSAEGSGTESDKPSDPEPTRDITHMPDAIAKRDASTTPTVTTPTPTTTIAVVPAAATEPAVVSTAIGDVTVQPGTTVHVDAATMPDDPAVTTVPHDGTAPSAQTVSGAEVAPDPVIVAAAKVASADAGVTVQAKG